MSLDSVIIDPIESGFDAVGMMQGDFAPLKRAALGGAIGYSIAVIFKPTVAYDKTGKALEFGSGKDQTYFPPWMFAAIPALIVSVMI